MHRNAHNCQGKGYPCHPSWLTKTIQTKHQQSEKSELSGLRTTFARASCLQSSSQPKAQALRCRCHSDIQSSQSFSAQRGILFSPSLWHVAISWRSQGLVSSKWGCHLRLLWVYGSVEKSETLIKKIQTAGKSLLVFLFLLYKGKLCRLPHSCFLKIYDLYISLLLTSNCMSSPFSPWLVLCRSWQLVTWKFLRLAVVAAPFTEGTVRRVHCNVYQRFKYTLSRKNKYSHPHG